MRDYAIFQTDEAGRIITWYAGAERLLGWQEHEAVGKSCALVFTPEDVENGAPEDELEHARTEGRCLDERWHMRKDGGRFFAGGALTRAQECEGGPVTFTKVMQDITRRKEQDDQLRRSLEEKSMLVREIHHRVKNNLQMLVSLLSLQASYTKEPHGVAAFEETESRVRAIGHIHEQLYTTDNLSTVEMVEYLAVLARELVALHTKAPGGLELSLNLGEMTLHIEKDIPGGLIANELVLNSLKHGLPSGSGRLQLTFKPSRHEDGSAWVRGPASRWDFRC